MATESRPAIPDYLALCLLVFTLLNFNGLAALYTGVPRTGEVPMASAIAFLPITLYLIARYARISNMGDIFWLFVLFFALYLVGSVVPPLVAHDFVSTDLVFVKQIVVAAVFTSAVYFWAATLSDAALVKVLRIAKGLLLIASLATIFSQQLASVLHYDPIPVAPDRARGIERALGFFANPGEAAAAALFCLVLVVAFPARSRLLTLAQGSIALAAVIMTFSRTGFLTVLLLGFFFLFQRPSIKAVALFLIGMMLVISALWSVFEYDLFGLARDQRQRLASLLHILTGQATEQTFGPRTQLLDIALSRIAEVFPWGAGISKFQAMEYGQRGGHWGVWLGVHNVYLMILGEAGLPAFVAFLAFWARTIWKVTNSAFRVFALGATVVFLVDLTTSHDILSLRLPNVMLAFVMVAAARSSSLRKTYFAPETAPDGTQP